MINIELYTSYFDKISEIKCLHYAPVAICGKSPDWYSGLEYKKLAPSWSIYSEWKYKHHNNDIYTERYNKERLAKLDPNQVINELINITNTNKIVLLCYEEPNEFCHRHLVAKWLNNIGYDVKEVEL